MIVVDASVVVKWFVPEAGNIEAKALLQNGHEHLAPELVRVEVSGALVRKAIAGEVSEDDARDLLRHWTDAILAGQIILVPSADHLPAASELALELRHPLPDCIYLAAAERLDVPLITADRVFVRRAAPRYPRASSSWKKRNAHPPGPQSRQRGTGSGPMSSARLSARKAVRTPSSTTGW